METAHKPRPRTRTVLIFASLFLCVPLDLCATDRDRQREISAAKGAEACRSITLVHETALGNGDAFGQVFDRRLYIFGVQYNYALIRSQLLELDYAPRLIPAALLAQPVVDHFALPRKLPPFTHNEITFGAGVSPAALELRFMPAKPVQPFVGVNVGFLYFTQRVPAPFAAQFNWTIQGSAGLRLHTRRRQSFLIAYSYHHLSNGGMAVENPGMDSHMISLGYTVVFGKHIR